MRETSKKVLFWALMFFGAFLLLTQVGYSDGDDAFFYQYTHEMGFFEYLSWRYQTWVGRMSGEAMVYIAFSLGIWFWRIVNAMMLVLLPCGVLKLAEKATGIRTKNFLPGESVAVVSGYLLMAIMTVGYAAIWINGSIFYTWSFTCGIWALVPVADIVFDTGDGGSGDHNTWHFFYSIPCAVLASMSIEQMAAVLVTFEVLAVLVVILRKHEKQRTILLIIQTAVTVVAFVILFLAPGNDIRVASEVQNWMPQYEELSFWEHLFVTVQWLVSSFANENRLLLFGIWLAGILHIICKNERKASDVACMTAAGLFSAAALLPFAGIKVFSDCGLHIADITVRLEQVPRIEEMQAANWFAMCWWIAALLFTCILIWKVSKHNVVLMLVWLGGIASEAIMHFSPTIYASGARVYYLTDWMCMFIILVLAFKMPGKRWRDLYYSIVAGLGVWNLLYQVINYI
jgi:hypothetical protein